MDRAPDPVLFTKTESTPLNLNTSFFLGCSQLKWILRLHVIWDIYLDVIIIIIVLVVIIIGIIALLIIGNILTFLAGIGGQPICVWTLQ